MLNKIIHFSLQNRILVLVASVLLLIGGTYTAFHTEVDVFPDLNAPTRRLPAGPAHYDCTPGQYRHEEKAGKGYRRN